MRKEKEFINKMFESLNNPHCDFQKELMTTEELEKVKKKI